MKMLQNNRPINLCYSGGVGPQSKGLRRTGAHTNASERVTLAVKSGEPLPRSGFRPMIDTGHLVEEGCEKIFQLERIESCTSSRKVMSARTVGTSQVRIDNSVIAYINKWGGGGQGVELCGSLQQKS